MTRARVPEMVTSAQGAWAILMVHPRLPARFLGGPFGRVVMYSNRLDARDAARHMSKWAREKYGVRLQVVPVTQVVTAQPSQRAARDTAARIAR